MNNFRKIIIFFTVFMLVALAAFFLLNKKMTIEKRDILLYNDYTHRICERIAAGESEETLEEEFGCSIIMDTDMSNPELAVLYSEGGIVLDLNVNGNYVGKVGWSDQMDEYNKARKNFFLMSLVFWGLVLLVGYGFLILIYFLVVKPIKEMNRFSEEIAKGNLDFELPIHRENLFGEFVEGFDIMREELKVAHEREIEAENARKELVAELSHDIKTPVSVIQATCEVMDYKCRKKLKKGQDRFDEGEIEDVLEKVNSISAKAETISHLMKDVMHSTMDDLDRVKVVKTEENSEFIEDYFKNLKDYGNIILENEIPVFLVYMDKQRLEQVIDNIVGNSHKYAGTDIHVSFSEASTPNRKGGKDSFLRIRIKDDGLGVPEDDLPLLTEKYYRGSNTKDQGGYGLGMYLSKKYMGMMGGDMEYYNDNGFVVELLLRKV